jgi:hypothetical protein
MLSSPAARGSKGERFRSGAAANLGRQPILAKPSTIWYPRARVRQKKRHSRRAVLTEPSFWSCGCRKSGSGWSTDQVISGALGAETSAEKLPARGRRDLVLSHVRVTALGLTCNPKRSAPCSKEVGAVLTRGYAATRDWHGGAPHH